MDGNVFITKSNGGVQLMNNTNHKNNKDKKNYYFDEQYIVSLWFSGNKAKQETQLKYIQQLNEGVLNKKLPYYMSKYNLIVDKAYEYELREELRSEILVNQLSQLDRFNRNKNLFSYLTQIAENVIKYRVQNIVKETNHVVSFYSMSQKDDDDVEYGELIDIIVTHSKVNGRTTSVPSTYITMDDERQNVFQSYRFDNIEKTRKVLFQLLNDLEQFDIDDSQNFVYFIKTLYSRYLTSINEHNSEHTITTLLTINKFIILSFKNIFKYKRKYTKKTMSINDVLKLTKYLDNISRIYFRKHFTPKVETVIKFEDLNGDGIMDEIMDEQFINQLDTELESEDENLDI